MSKPVVWRVFRNNQWTYRASPNESKEERVIWQPLFAHRQEWQNLTPTDIKVLWIASNNKAEFAELLQARLKELNT